MTPDVVVDVGNTRIKWGRVSGRRVVEVVTFGHDDPEGWQRQCEAWELTPSARWALAGVVPQVQVRLEAWLAARGMSAVAITNDLFSVEEAEPFTFVTAVDEPGQIGVDRLLTAFAAWRRSPPGASAVALNVGTAMTIDFVESSGLHRGGAILPGPRLMARSLHEHTAKLPHVEVDPEEPPVTIWGENTAAAIEHGIANAILGAADRMVWSWTSRRETPPAVFATGGDVGYFRGFKFTGVTTFEIDPALTLDGIRLAAEALP